MISKGNINKNGLTDLSTFIVFPISILNKMYISNPRENEIFKNLKIKVLSCIVLYL
tara:strand:+ start:243 stop:410 length:168 start_codon:yes stop_codon:yes gene_type:complete